MPSSATAKRLFDEGKVREAQKELAAYLREHPADTAQRTFLFELLCFSGDYDRAEKQLGAVPQASSQTELGAVLYYSALHAERLRHGIFERQEFPANTSSTSPSGKLNGKSFKALQDADPDI